MGTDVNLTSQKMYDSINIFFLKKNIFFRKKYFFSNFHCDQCQKSYSIKNNLKTHGQTLLKRKGKVFSFLNKGQHFFFNISKKRMILKTLKKIYFFWISIVTNVKSYIQSKIKNNLKTHRQTLVNRKGQKIFFYLFSQKTIILKTFFFQKEN